MYYQELVFTVFVCSLLVALVVVVAVVTVAVVVFDWSETVFFYVVLLLT